MNNGEHMFVLSVCVCMSVQVDNAKKKRIFFRCDSRKAPKSITAMDAINCLAWKQLVLFDTIQNKILIDIICVSNNTSSSKFAPVSLCRQLDWA